MISIYIAALFFVFTPGVIGALFSKKVNITKPFKLSYKEVVVSSVLFGITYTVLRRYFGAYIEGFYQYQNKFLETSCDITRGPKCFLKPNTTAASGNLAKDFYKLGQCTQTGNTYTCMDNLDIYNSTYSLNKIVPPNEQPRYDSGNTDAETKRKAQAENDFIIQQQKIQEEVAKKEEARKQTEAALLKDKDIQAFIRRTYKDKKTNKLNEYTYVSSVAQQQLSANRNAINKKIADAMRKKPDDARPPISEEAYNAYVKTLP
jgi:hypothetical protein